MHLILLLATSLSALLLPSTPTLSDNDSIAAAERLQALPKAIEETRSVLMKKEEGLPIIGKLDAFVASLSGDYGFLLHVDMQAELASEEAKKRFTDYAPKFRSAMIMMLSSYTATELATPDSKEQLQAQAKQLINELMEAEEEQAVTRVLFTTFTILKP
ncbi:flagellar basal body-associated FliL family protein [Chromobacterium rhizoryzae]|uniref:flagellar basal body-associated FliL family protein n=1 Tax=Chromobacterium rhizoryzae TaxID=1778675 RepID=UPI001D079AB1|nr:flagellar basal body-associated FliL family protein [Chromobacterium rhizoryzae]